MKGTPHDRAVHAQAVMRTITVIACTARSCGVLFIKSGVATKENTHMMPAARAATAPSTQPRVQGSATIFALLQNKNFCRRLQAAACAAACLKIFGGVAARAAG